MLEKRLFKSSPYIFFLIAAITAKEIKANLSLSGFQTWSSQNIFNGNESPIMLYIK